jgi:hypothetical protein
LVHSPYTKIGLETGD